MKAKNTWCDGDGVDQADRYLRTRRLPAGTTSSLRKAMKAQRIAGQDILTPKPA